MSRRRYPELVDTKTVEVPGPEQWRAGGAHPLRVTLISMACCSVEAATGLTEFDNISTGLPDLGAPDSALNVLVVAGTVTRLNSHLVRAAFDRLPQPRAVVAFGVCTISGGPYWDSYAVLPGIGDLVPVAVFVPGCPPHPSDLSAALDTLAGRSAALPDGPSIGPTVGVP